MRRSVTFLAPLLALAVAAQGTPALAASTSGSRAPIAAAAGDPPNRTADQFDLWSTLSPQAWDESLEEGCIETGSDACKMTAQQVKQLPDDLKKLDDQLRAEILANPAEMKELQADRAGQPRGIGGFAGSVTRTLTKFTSNPLVKRLGDKADEIGDIAGHLTEATYVHDGLTAGNAFGVAKNVVYLMPVVGDVFALGEAIANGDVESGVVATISLVGTAVGAVFPPAGAVIAVGLAIYYVSKLIWGYFCAQPRDWIADPPANPQETFESGADIKWETYPVAGQDVVMEIHADRRTAQATQTLLLDSKWTDYNQNRKPVNYTIRPIVHPDTQAIDEGWSVHDVWGAESATFTVWQGGKEYKNACNVAEEPTQWGAPHRVLKCGPKTPLTVGLGRPAVIKITSTYNYEPEYDPFAAKCARGASKPCVVTLATNRGGGYLNVFTEAKRLVQLTVPFSIALI